ncbi:OmpA family protein [Hahella aquimaris]|uniref:OmpA family protein n=1 Tax=Hahella sp. HNIBRBA332 TaxID=3015983 RepID=UPI00273CB656|nr:OmpA family protein [Hahella sp. HNIBRBA332]WLQ12449.1 OmpA family protein [Hahella sp. HNIBRBA332]
MFISKKLYRLFTASSLALAITACSSTPVLKQEPAAVSLDEAKQLYAQMETARDNDVHLYAPDAYGKAVEAYNEALDLSRSKPTVAAAKAQAGLTYAAQAEKQADAARGKLQAIENARQAAIAASGEELLGEEFASADKQLRDIAAQLEKQPGADNSKAQTALAGVYRDIELRSLKLDVTGKARKAIEQARKEDIDDRAPKTLRVAEEEMLLALSTLENDRTQQEKARRHANSALTQVQHARVIAAQAAEFDARDASLEDILLWHEARLAEAVQPVVPEIPFEKGPAQVKESINEALNRLQQEKLTLRHALAEAEVREVQSAANLETMKQEMEQKLLAVQLETDAAKRASEEIQRRFEFVQELFTLTEADVYRQNANVLIRAHGFKFASGSSEVQRDNVTLLNKIIDAIEAFPNCKIRISGHTDNRGDRALNQSLSEKRASNVAKFLANVGSIDSSRIEAEGFGASRPVANNDTKEGRAANRRVEVLIINDANLP